jgi:cyclopropane fatty-acyl-phospholipid synthase-like methyltransferase
MVIKISLRKDYTMNNNKVGLDNIDFVRKNMMGPSSIRLVTELTDHIVFQKGMRVLDLGCGTGLTSIYLASKFGVTVYATDLWISATDNDRRFKEVGLDDQIIPIHADANSLPYADEYFDAVISVDAYHYFGANDEYLDKRLAPLVKKGGIIAIAMPGLKAEFGGVAPAAMQPHWSPDDDTSTWHSCEWWRNVWESSPNVHIQSVEQMTCFSEAWNDWLQCDNDYARGDIEMLKADDGKYLNFVSIIATKK